MNQNDFLAGPSQPSTYSDEPVISSLLQTVDFGSPFDEPYEATDDHQTVDNLLDLFTRSPMLGAEDEYSHFLFPK